ncbi:hypothetical protein QUF76_12260 [Desulfobacterales bacterium HSG16]|nr:hypothetical protein [Desulfobacterales bacterium HSG16]
MGRPDGTPSPGQYGRATAAPLLFAIVDSLPRRYRKPSSIPDNVDMVQICWPLGTAPSSKNDKLCHHRRKAWILDGVIPPTLPDRMDKFWQKNPVQILINPATGLRIDFDCPAQNPVMKKIARWPKAAFPWLKPYLQAASRIPKLDPDCKRPVSNEREGIKIMGLEPHTILRPPGSQTRLPEISLSAQGGKGSLYWLLDDVLIARTKIGTTYNYKFNRPGSFRLTVMDMAGDYDAVDIVVLGG